MEFRYRANDVDRPPPATDTAPSQSPNPNSSLLLGSSEIHVREAIQREIEKEQIRQDIIIAEAVKKRELLGEVLQEMAMEKEMAKRSLTGTGMTLDEKLTMLINQTKLPNQIQSQNNLFRHKCSYIDPLINIGSYNSLVSSSSMIHLPPLQQIHEATRTSTMEPNKERLIVLERADSVGEKRKAEDSQTGLERAKRIAADGVNVGFSSRTQLLGSTVGGLNEDLHQKTQKAEESILKEKPMSAKTVESDSLKLPSLGKLTNPVEGKLKKSFKFWCDTCKVRAYCPTVMRNHVLGKKHKSAITQQNKLLETASTSEAIKVLENCQKVDEMSVKETGKKTEEEKKKKVILFCKICNVRTNSELMMKSHKLGKKHKVMLEKQAKKNTLAMDHTKGKVHGLN